MKRDEVYNILCHIFACTSALDWVLEQPEESTWRQLWHTCPRGDWLLYLLAKYGYSTRDKDLCSECEKVFHRWFYESFGQHFDGIRPWYLRVDRTMLEEAKEWFGMNKEETLHELGNLASYVRLHMEGINEEQLRELSPRS